METYKLNIKIGPHEFNGEGAEESVRRDFEEWKALISSLPVVPSQNTSSNFQSNGGVDGNEASVAGLERIFLFDEKKKEASLRVFPRTESRDADAILLIVLGYRMKFNQHDVSVGQIKSALKQTGIKVDRVDKTVAKYVREGYLNKGGTGRGGRYSLTNAGVMKGNEVLNTLMK
ncbi:MAG TPA: hypothetical protein VF525_09105 [Pyrinomonadaceae bacterium]